LVEVIGTIAFLFASAKLFAPEYLPIGLELTFPECIILLVFGLLCMGYKRIPREIGKIIRGK